MTSLSLTVELHTTHNIIMMARQRGNQQGKPERCQLRKFVLVKKNKKKRSIKQAEEDKESTKK